MATVADLSVNILANTAGFNPQVDGVRNKLSQAFREPVGGVEQLAHSMHGLEGQLRGMNALIGLGFGATIGRHVFAELHEEVLKVGEGFGEAQAHGDSFWASMGAGVQHALGLHTAREMFDSVTDAIDASRHRLNEFDKGIGHLIEQLKLGDEVVAGGLLFQADKRFAGLDSKSQFEAEHKKLEEEKKQILDMTSQANLEKAGIAPAKFTMYAAGFGFTGTLEDMTKQRKRLETEQTHRMDDIRQREHALEDLAEQARVKEAQDKQDQLNDKAVEAAEKTRKEQEHQAQEELNKAIRQRAEQLKHDGELADRIRAQDDAMQRFKQEAAEAERLHAEHPLSDDEFTTRINKLQGERVQREAEERKKQGFAPGGIGGAVEAGTNAAQHILAEARQALTSGNPLVAAVDTTNKILLDIKAQGDKDAADKKLDNNKTLIAAVASIT